MMNVIRNRVCESCGIDVRKLGVLDAKPGAVTMVSWIFLNPQNGEQWVAPSGASAREVTVFDASGKHVRTISGLNGKPFGSISLVRFTAAGETLLADRESGTMYRMRSSSDVTGSEISVKMEVNDALSVTKEHLVVSADVRTSRLAGVPLHVLDATGTIVRSFGEVAGEAVLPGKRLRRHRILANGGESSFWAGSYNHYALQLWSLEGTLLKTIRSEPEWFVPWSSDPTQPPTMERPQTMLKSVYQDADGMLWIQFQVPDVNWKRITPETNSGPESGHMHVDVESISPQEVDRLYDTIIEVVDLKTGQLVTSRRFDEVLGPFVGPRQVARIVQHTPQRRNFEVWDLRLNR